MSSSASVYRPPGDQPVPKFYVWSFPGCPIRIRLSLALVPRLREFVNQASKLSSAEVGGLLLGSARPDRVEITGFEPFVRSKDPGQHFKLNAEEKSRLKGEIGRYPDVVGYFRTDVREGLRLYDEDLSLIDEFFPEPTNVFMIIRREDSETPTAGFFFWDGSEVFANSTFLPFPLDEQLLQSRTELTVLTREGAVAPAPVTPAPVDPGLEPAAPAAPAVRKSGRGLMAALVLLLTLGAMGGAWLYTKRGTSAPVSSATASPFGLKVTPAGPDISISWNAKVQTITDARVAVLTIRDGDGKREVPMSPTMLQSSNLLYTPKADMVQVELEVFTTDGKSSREAVMLLRPTGQNSAQHPSPSSYAVTIPVPAQRQPSPAGNRPEPPRDDATVRNEPAPIRNDPAPVQPEEKRQFSAPQTKPTARPDVNVHLEAPPAITQGTAAPPRESLQAVKTPVLPTPQAPPQPAPERVPTPESTQPPAPELAKDSAPQPAPERLTSRDRVEPNPVRFAAEQPPKPLRQVQPTLPPNVKALISAPTNIQVRVKINQQGKVVRADPIAKSGTLAGYLGAAAATATRLWTFEPARRGDEAVESELILQFTFSPERAKF
jgi:protein TonB